MDTKTVNVPKAMQNLYDEIMMLISPICSQFLNTEYEELAKKVTAALCRKRPSPLTSGKKTVWAAGILNAVGTINYLFDKSHPPYMSTQELCQCFGVATSTAGNRAKEIRRMLDMTRFDHQWMLPSNIKNSPAIWMLRVNGFYVDIRQAPYELQQLAFDKGLIPYIPADSQ